MSSVVVSVGAGSASVLAPDCPPNLIAAKIVTLSTDVDEDGNVSPGDILLYTVGMYNDGSMTATDVVFSDTLDSRTNLVTGTVQTTQGTVLEGNGPGDRSVFVSIGDIPVGLSHAVIISFQAAIANPFPPGSLAITNQGIVSSTQVITDTDNPYVDDPGTDDPDPTVITVTATPLLSFGADVPQCLLPGATSGVTWTITNEGNGAFAGGVVTTTDSFNCTDSACQATGHVVGAIAGQSTYTLMQQVTVPQPLPYGAEAVTLTASMPGVSSAPSPYEVNLHVCAPDLRASDATVSSTKVFAHEMISYTWYLRNTGDADAFGARGIFTPANVPLYDFVDVISVTEGAATWDANARQVVWEGDLLISDTVTVTFRTASSFGLKHLELTSPFEVAHPWRPVFTKSVNYPYPYKLFLMLVVRNATP
ncbi:MAG: hypothetical protein M1546_24020 [Chloroflexi bacterium]|nr:hypothetical protein [Chloroflexota bacterium]